MPKIVVADPGLQEALLATRVLLSASTAAALLGVVRQAVYQSSERAHGQLLMWVFRRELPQEDVPSMEEWLGTPRPTEAYVDFGWREPGDPRTLSPQNPVALRRGQWQAFESPTALLHEAARQYAQRRAGHNQRPLPPCSAQRASFPAALVDGSAVARRA